MTYKCIVCESDVPDYVPQMCCSGYMCGCKGLPIEPPLCSVECGEKIFGGGRGITVTDKKLTDKQREQMWQENTLSMLRYNLENGTQTISNEEVVTLIDDIQRLRSSEQAWKEEVERLQHEIESHAPEGRNYTNVKYVDLRLELERVKKERDDYRQGLEWYESRGEVDDWDVGYHARSIISRYKKGDTKDE